MNPIKMDQSQIDKIDLQDLDDNYIPHCSFCLARLFNNITVLGPCGHIFHEECVERLIQCKSFICPNDRREFTEKSHHKIYGHDLVGLMKNVEKTIKKWKDQALENKNKVES